MLARSWLFHALATSLHRMMPLCRRLHRSRSIRRCDLEFRPARCGWRERAAPRADALPNVVWKGFSQDVLSRFGGNSDGARANGGRAINHRLHGLCPRNTRRMSFTDLGVCGIILHLLTAPCGRFRQGRKTYRPSSTSWYPANGAEMVRPPAPVPITR